MIAKEKVKKRNFEQLLSASASCSQPSAIREICKLINRPGMRSLAGGWPDPNVFPGKEIAAIAKGLLEMNAGVVLQYGTTEGLLELRTQLAAWAGEKESIQCSQDDILVTHGSAQAMDLACRILLDPGDVVLVELPTYFGGVGAIRSCGAEAVGVELDQDGLDPDHLEKRLKQLKKQHRRVKGVYVIPNFQNPTGATLSLERRKQLLALADKYNFMILEDDPYSDLRGGAFYNVGAVLTGIGLADAANAFAVIKKLVFDEKVTTLREICAALDHNWAGYAPLWARALKCPKYGNDDDFVDCFAVEITNLFHYEIRKYKDRSGQPFNSAFMGISNYVPAGAVVGATPDGRLAGTPLTEGCSPHAGTDVTSPTAAMRSAAKISHESHVGGTLLNIKFSPEALKTDKDLRNLAAMIRAYFELGAFHVQFNVVSMETLRDAQAHPENHQDLLVRVAGYSTRFVNLSKEVQDAIIMRTTYQSL